MKQIKHESILLRLYCVYTANKTVMFESLQKLTYQALLSGVLAVDTFFMLRYGLCDSTVELFVGWLLNVPATC